MDPTQILSDGLLSVPAIRCYPGMRGYQTIPDRATGVAVASSASANTYGTSTQLTAGLPYDAYLVGALMGSPGAAASDAYAQLGIDVGPSGGPKTIAEIKLLSHLAVTATGVIMQSPVMFPYPVLIPAGTRIAAKTARSVATAVSYLIHLLFVPANEVRPLAQLRLGISGGATPWPNQGGLFSARTIGSGRGSVIVPAAGFNGVACVTGTSPAYGSYVQLNASLPFDYLVTHLQAGNFALNVADTFIQCGLGIGAAGAEYSISDIVFLRKTIVSATGETAAQPTALPIGLLVPAGSRLAVRLASSQSANSLRVDVCGTYVRSLSAEV